MYWQYFARKYLGVEYKSRVWDFLFCHRWSIHSEFNTPEAAVERIDLLLKHGPEKIEEFSYGRFTMGCLLNELRGA